MSISNLMALDTAEIQDGVKAVVFTNIVLGVGLSDTVDYSIGTFDDQLHHWWLLKRR